MRDPGLDPGEMNRLAFIRLPDPHGFALYTGATSGF